MNQSIQQAAKDNPLKRAEKAAREAITAWGREVQKQNAVLIGDEPDYWARESLLELFEQVFARYNLIAIPFENTVPNSPNTDDHELITHRSYVRIGACYSASLDARRSAERQGRAGGEEENTQARWADEIALQIATDRDPWDEIESNVFNVENFSNPDKSLRISEYQIRVCHQIVEGGCTDPERIELISRQIAAFGRCLKDTFKIEPCGSEWRYDHERPRIGYIVHVPVTALYEVAAIMPVLEAFQQTIAR